MKTQRSTSRENNARQYTTHRASYILRRAWVGYATRCAGSVHRSSPQRISSRLLDENEVRTRPQTAEQPEIKLHHKRDSHQNVIGGSALLQPYPHPPPRTNLAIRPVR